MVYLLTQASVIVTTTRIFAANSMRGHLALSPALPKLGHVRPRTRLEIRLGATARLGSGRGGEFACVGTAVPCFTAYDGITACSNHLKKPSWFW